MIGIFDSGVGGMTVAKAVEQYLPDYPLVYFGDIAKAPYGPKSPQTIIEYSLKNSEFLIEKGAKVIIIACNSAASVATKKLRATFDIPILEVIEPAVIAAVKNSKKGRIGVIGTKATIHSDIYKKLIMAKNDSAKVTSTACPLLVPLVEEGWLNKRETKMILRRYLHPMRHQQLDTLILGCTHYPILKDLIQYRIGKKVTLVDSSIEVAKALKDYLANNSPLAKELCATELKSQYYVSDMTETVHKTAQRIFNRPQPLTLI